MRRFLFLVALVVITLVAGCNSSKTTVAQLYNADEDATWTAVLASVKSVTGKEPESVDAKSRTIVVKGAYVDESAKKADKWDAIIQVNPSDLDPKLLKANTKDSTWVVIKTSSSKSLLSSSTMRGTSAPVDTSKNGESPLDKFLITVQKELDKTKS